MNQHNILGSSVDLGEVASLTKNYTGAELEGIIKSAQSYAISDWKHSPESHQSQEHCKVEQHHFRKAIEEVPSQFGKDNRVL